MSSSQTQTEAFTSDIPWHDTDPDCLVICCSDHRYEQQTRMLVRHLDFKRPHVLQFPSGAVLSLPLVSSINFLSKAVDRIIERIVETKNVRDIVLVTHHDCGAYKVERVSLVSDVIKRVTGKTVHDLQREHIVQAARRLHLGHRGVTVRAFFADVVKAADGDRVRFEEVPV